jgi:hypothetical protein
MFTIVERRPISSELAEAASIWLTRHRLEDEIDEGWLELVCEDGDVFTADTVMLHLAVPPGEVAPGEELDVGRTQTVGELWPEPGAPAGEVPRALALARTLERRDKVWFAACELPGPVRDLFTVEQPAAMLAVMNATRRTLGRGPLSISGDPDGQITFTLVDGAVTAWGSTEAEVGEAFRYWLDSGPAMELATPLQGASQVVGSLGGLSDLMLRNNLGVEARCFLDVEQPVPEPLPEDYFENHAQGRVEALRVDRAGGLGRDALAAIANLRPHDVTLQLTEGGSLVISGRQDEAPAFELGGPGFSTLAERPGTTIVVPYMVALALYDGAVAGPVDISLDGRHGRLRRADQGITVEWVRAA